MTRLTMDSVYPQRLMASGAQGPEQTPLLSIDGPLTYIKNMMEQKPH